MVGRTSGDAADGGKGRKASGSRSGSKSKRKPSTRAKSASAKGAAPTPEPLRGRARGLEPASKFLSGALADAAAKRGIAETKLMTRWDEIVGADLGAATQPLRLKRRGGLALGGVLAVAVDGARATEIEHKIPQIIERVNAYYGYRAVAEIALTQAVDASYKPQIKPSRRPKRLVATEDEKRQAAEIAGGIEDNALRAALARLGENVIARAAEKRRGPVYGDKRAQSDPARPSAEGVASKTSSTRPGGED
ncbi:MAG: DciA family protein [Neomegalonema sp.]|nr:DciA family protein [Neomegalonema sp.]